MGLFIGGSLLTCVEFIVYFVKKICQKRQTGDISSTVKSETEDVQQSSNL